ncbi:acyltransferase [Actinomycetota bacterium]|nr:acyltransferase [Actinomycetota bacterium]
MQNQELNKTQELVEKTSFFSKPFDRKKNSLNLIRLVLALTVILDHAFTLGDYGDDITFFDVNLGAWAVTGFFCISGYLIAGSRLNGKLGEFLIKRIARIYPGFFVVQVLTLVLFAPIAKLLNDHTLSGYMTETPTPVHYFIKNLTLSLWMENYEIGNTLSNVPAVNTWNGPLYTLFYEFTSYLIVAILLSWFVTKKTPVFVGIWIVGIVLQFNFQRVSLWDQTLQPGTGHNVFFLLVRLVPIFLGGSIVFMVQRRFKKFYWQVALVSLIVTFAVLFTVPLGEAKLGIISPFLTYVLLWFANTFTFGKVGAFTIKHDISYGVYIYGWVMQQMIMLFVVNGFIPKPPIWLYDLATIELTLFFATLSWLLVERPVLMRVRGESIKKRSKKKQLQAQDLSDEVKDMITHYLNDTATEVKPTTQKIR